MRYHRRNPANRYRRNPIKYPIARLPRALSEQDAVDVAYRQEIEEIYKKLLKGVSVLLECDKQLISYLYAALRNLSKANLDAGLPTFHTVRNSAGELRPSFKMISGRSPDEEGQPAKSLLDKYVKELKEAVNAGEGVIIIPHLDLLATEKGGLTDTAKEIIATLYENPEIVILGFKDPEFALPKSLSRIFPAKASIAGIRRDVLPRLLTQVEARKLGFEDFDPFSLYKYLSGVNAVRLREIVELILDDDNLIDFDGDDQHLKKIYRQIRELTTEGLALSDITFKDIAGYDDIKTSIKRSVLRPMLSRDAATTAEEVQNWEAIISDNRGILFEGPPGTGKTLFAKAIANEIDATYFLVSGPALKSKWVGESESNLREIFTKARASAPSIIIFDEIDSFATQRGSQNAGDSSVTHSMVNQLLTEMDGFNKEELVFVVGTTNYAKSLDQALLRPGRFNKKFAVPYPNDKDRGAILELYNKKYKLGLNEGLIKDLVGRTSGYVDELSGMRYSGDHLRSIAGDLRLLVMERRAEGRDPSITEADIANLGSLSGAVSDKKVLWDEVAGYKAVKEELMDKVIEPFHEYMRALEDPSTPKKLLEDLYRQVPNGIIFEGPRGTGKTYLAKAVATAIGARTKVVKDSELVSKWIGESAENIHSLFEEARRDTPCVIIFDEFDSIASARSTAANDSGGSKEMNNIVNAILSEMGNGFQKKDLVLVIATTNLAGSLDAAIADRPGRFMKPIHIGAPSPGDRKDIFENYNKKLNLDLSEDLIKYLVKRTHSNQEQQYFADHLLAICINLEGLRKKKNKARVDPTITKEDIDGLRLLKTKYEEPMPTADDEIAIAVHECGHALVSALLDETENPHLVTLEGGEHDISKFYTQFEAKASIRQTRGQIIAAIAVALSGKVAEELYTGQASSGVFDDLMAASDMARKMVELYGMGSFQESLYQKDKQGLVRRPISPERERLVDEEVDSILREAHDMVSEIYMVNRDLLEKMVDQLLIKKTLTWPDIEKIINRALRRMMRRYR